MRFSQPRNWAEARQFLQSNPPETPGAGGGTPPEPRRSAGDVLQQYGGDAIRMAERVVKLEEENYRYRDGRRDLTEKIAGLETQVAALQGKQVPDGATVLTGTDAAAYDAYKALGKPEEIKAGLDERQSLATEVASAKRDTTLRDVAAAAGMTFPVLRKLGADREYEIRDVTDAEGKTAKVAHIKDGDAFKPLLEYAKADPDWNVFYPALVAEPATPPAPGPAAPAPRPAPTFPPQRPSAVTPAGSQLDQFVKERNERAAKATNPLAQPLVVAPPA